MKLLISAAVLSVLSVQATAQGYESSNLGFEMYRYDEGDGINASFATVRADAGYKITPQLGLQLGIAGSVQLDASAPFLNQDTSYSFALHGFYDINADIRVGLLLGADSYNDIDYVTAIEAIYAPGPYRVEARLGRYASDIEPADLIEAQGSYKFLPQLSGRANYQRINYDGGFGYFELASLGASYDVTPQAEIYASYGSTTNDFGIGGTYAGNQITFGVNLAVGGDRNDKLFSFNPFF